MWWCFIILRMEKFRVGYYIRIHGSHMMITILLFLLAAAVHCRAGRSSVLFLGVEETTGESRHLRSQEEGQYMEGNYTPSTALDDDQFRRNSNCCHSQYCEYCSSSSSSSSRESSTAVQEGALDPVNYNVDERLVPTGPDPLHN